MDKPFQWLLRCAGPDKYSEHGYTTPREGPICMEGRSHFQGKEYIFDVKRLKLIKKTKFSPLLPESKPILYVYTALD